MPLASGVVLELCAAPDWAVLLCWAALELVALWSLPLAWVLAGLEATALWSAEVLGAAVAGVLLPVLLAEVWLDTGGVVCVALEPLMFWSALPAAAPAAGAAEALCEAEVSPEVAAPEVPPILLAEPLGLELLLQVAATSFTSETVMLCCEEACEEVLPLLVELADELLAAAGLPVT